MDAAAATAAGAAEPASGATGAAADAANRRVAALTAAASIEISPRDELAGERLRDLFRPGTRVFVNYPASVTHHDIVAACVRLRRTGFEPVPHVAARRLASYTQAADFLRRAAGEAAVGEALLTSGDADPPVGPFHDSLALLASGVVERHGITRVGFAGHPEGHPRVAGGTLETALRSKIELARQVGLAVEVVTQFGFEPAPVLRWIAALHRDLPGGGCPVLVGVAGPASVATLAKFAVRCGIGTSLRALARDHTAFARILTEASPDRLIQMLVAGEDPAAPIAGLHVFTFGGLRRTAEWLRGRR
jgi:methylenetetrahydrofolate reductase (NADPH)